MGRRGRNFLVMVTEHNITILYLIIFFLDFFDPEK